MDRRDHIHGPQGVTKEAATQIPHSNTDITVPPLYVICPADVCGCSELINLLLSHSAQPQHHTTNTVLCYKRTSSSSLSYHPSIAQIKAHTSNKQHYRKDASHVLNAPIARPDGVADSEPTTAVFVNEGGQVLRSRQYR